jgi:tripartite-type tricarboxylate transporter receptor subunit TctC
MKTAYKVLGLFLAFALTLACGESTAQSYPSKPIRFVVGYPPGGSSDILARIVSQKLADRLGQPVVVDNRPGADSIIATEYVTKAAPDGYTLLVGGIGNMTILNPDLHDRRLAYDPVKDFIPITMFATDPLVFAVHPSVPATSIKELIALAKAKPGALFYAAGAPPMQLAAEFFKKLAGVNIVHVPYKGTGPSVTAAVSREVPLVVVSIAPALAQLRAGKLRALAVTSLKRDSLLPDIPTVSESGLDFVGGIWIGLFAPAGTPSATIDKLYSELSVILKSESLKEHFASLGYETSEMGLSPAEFGAFFRADLAKWAKLTRDFNPRAN